MDRLPPELLEAIAAHLSAADLAALAQCCSDLNRASRDVLERRGLTVRQSKCAAVLPHWTRIRRLTVIGVSSWASLRHRGPSPPPCLWLPAMPLLRRLDLHMPAFPADFEFWPAVLAGCPQLRDVRARCNFGWAARYVAHVGHALQLVRHGAGVLRRLEVRSAEPATPWPLGMCMKPCRDIAGASGVAGGGDEVAVRHFEVDDPCGGILAFLVRSSPGPVVATQELRWRVTACSFDGRLLAAFSRLRHLALCLRGPLARREVGHAVAALRDLPPSIETLELRLEAGDRGMFDADDDDDDVVAWGTPLRHLTRLRRLAIHATMEADASLTELAGSWLGVGGDSVRHVEAVFDCDDERLGGAADAAWDAGPLAAWLQAHPHATATVANTPLPVRGPCHHARARFPVLRDVVAWKGV